MFTRKWFEDVAERVAATFVMAFLGVVILAGAGMFALATLKAAAVAGVAAAGSLLKGALATLVGARNSASLVPSVANPADVARKSDAGHASVRVIFAVVLILCGVVVVAKGGFGLTNFATGFGLIVAGVAILN